MKRGSIFAVIMMVFAGLVMGASNTRDRAVAQVGPVLQNRSFELPYHEQGAGEVKIADKWMAWWWEGDPPQEIGQGPCARPEYKPIDGDLYPYRVTDGDTSQCWFSFSRVSDAGIFQRVENIQDYSLVTFELDAQTWCSNSDNPNTDDGECYLSLGIDPTGYTDPSGRSPSIRWIQWVRLTRNFQRVRATVYHETAGAVTVFVRGWNKWRLKHSDWYIDNARLSVSPVGGCTPQPTYTPYPTDLPKPTYTPYPTFTPQPTRPTVCPTECPTCTPGDCPSLDAIRTVVAERPPVIWPREE